MAASEEPPSSRPDQPRGPAPYQPPWPAQPLPSGRPSLGLAVASLLLGLLGVFLSWFTFGIPSLLAVALGAVAIRRANVGGGSRALGTAGLVLGLIPVLILGGFAVLLAAGYIASN
jgi:hypothetical protein